METKWKEVDLATDSFDEDWGRDGDVVQCWIATNVRGRFTCRIGRLSDGAYVYEADHDGDPIVGGYRDQYTAPDYNTTESFAAAEQKLFEALARHEDD